MASRVVSYPTVIGEFETIRAVLKRRSLSRFGDGELKIMDGNGYSREKPNRNLTNELRKIVKEPNAGCLVGIPTMDPAGSRYWNWKKHKARFCKFLGRIKYYSSLVTRPDCGEWMETREYAEHLQRIWAGRDVAIISEPESKLLEAVRRTNDVVHIECPMYCAYSRIDHLEADALASGADLVLISAGPTATCLANRLAPYTQAVDLGSVGGFLLRKLWN